MGIRLNDTSKDGRSPAVEILRKSGGRFVSDTILLNTQDVNTREYWTDLSSRAALTACAAAGGTTGARCTACR